MHNFFEEGGFGVSRFLLRVGSAVMLLQPSLDGSCEPAKTLQFEMYPKKEKGIKSSGGSLGWQNFIGRNHE